MSIQVVCPNGHVLKVNESMAGRSGLCPKCRARVNVPRGKDDFSEDAILGLLNTDAPVVARPATAAAPDPQPAPPPASNAPKKLCSKCNREIFVGMHICPHCHTYIAGLRDF
jgi:hypothetical protein